MTKVRLENVHTDQIRELGEYEYVELTYESLRVGPDGEFIGHYDSKLDWWVIDADGSQWSDIVIYAE